MIRMKKRTTIALSTAAATAFVGGLAAVGSTSSSTATEPAELAPISALSTAAPASPTDIANTIDDAVAADYGIGTSTGRWIEAPTPNTDVASSSRSTEGRWLVLPGSSGVCVVFPDRDYTCGGRTGEDGGVLILTTRPAPAQAPPTTNGAGSKTTSERLDPTPGPGPGTVRGLMPDRVVRVAALDKHGSTIASTTVSGNVYELRVPQARDMAAVATYDATGRQLARY